MVASLLRKESQDTGTCGNRFQFSSPASLKAAAYQAWMMEAGQKQGSSWGGVEAELQEEEQRWRGELMEAADQVCIWGEGQENEQCWRGEWVEAAEQVWWEGQEEKQR